jgi:hypothetical protein
VTNAWYRHAMNIDTMASSWKPRTLGKNVSQELHYARARNTTRPARLPCITINRRRHDDQAAS